MRREPPVDPPVVEECHWHPWDEDARGPQPAGPCPDCLEEYEASLPDTVKEAEGLA